jgi:hypothetical protein
MKQNKKFQNWFKKQFGKLPQDCRSYSEIIEELNSAQSLVARLKKERDEYLYLQNSWLASRYTTLALKKDFKV